MTAQRIDAAAVEPHIATMLGALGLDLKDENLVKTPHRVAKCYAQDLMCGYDQDPKAILSTRFQSSNTGLVILRNIEFYSTCAHHLLPFTGKAHVAYIPMGYVVGLSKLARVVECFARRLQLQEQLTDEIANSVQSELAAKGVGVVMQAQHMCMSARGVAKQRSEMVTSALRGVFLEPATRAEFMSLVR